MDWRGERVTWGKAVSAGELLPGSRAWGSPPREQGQLHKRLDVLFKKAGTKAFPFLLWSLSSPTIAGLFFLPCI